MARTKRETVSQKEIEMGMQDEMEIQEDIENEEYKSFEERFPWEAYTRYRTSVRNRSIEPMTFDEYYGL